MGKKLKTGKQRKDRFYHLAKETGYRSRASFKLIQLNRKFEFLQKSRVLIDLCAAPGGWLQVAQKHMPVSSVIIGVDLVPIKPIPNVITLQQDITTDSCRQALKRELKTWKADIVLNDGAPNVGKSWTHDAFIQSQLTLHALKLAAELLVKGGWFITKVFRSKDYHSLIWLFKKLFKRVHVTKPQASRNESAEIFVVCESYLCPDKIDPKFFDPASVFEEVDPEPKSTLNVLHPEKDKSKAEGYPEGDYTLYHKLKASEFINSANHIELLSKFNEITIDLESIKNHPSTTEDIKEYCKDIKVLGKSELRSLIKWRKSIKKTFDEQEKANKDKTNDVVTVEEEEDEEAKIQRQIEEIQMAKTQELKRKKKKVLKERRKLREKMDLKMIIKDDEPIIQEDEELFRLSKIRNKLELAKVKEDDNFAFTEDAKDLEESDTDSIIIPKKESVAYERGQKRVTWNDMKDVESSDGESSSLSFEDEDVNRFEVSDEDVTDDDDEHSDNSDDANPLLIDLEDKKGWVRQQADKWFENSTFKELLSEDDGSDDDLEIAMMIEDKKNKISKENKGSSDANDNSAILENGADEEPDFADLQVEPDSDDEEEEEEEKKIEIASNKGSQKKKRKRLDPTGLALGTMMIQSKKAKRDIIDEAYNRFTFNDENLPDWFVKDEVKHYRKQVPVTAAMVAEYRAWLKEINARPVKKVAQAKARKKRKAMKKLEKARKKAEAITENLDMSEKEKMDNIKNIYKKAQVKKDNKVTYVVAKKGVGKRVRRPHGVSGKFKVVDPRMKKDNRKKKFEDKLKKKGGRRKGKGKIKAR